MRKALLNSYFYCVAFVYSVNFVSGAHIRTRTGDLFLTKEVLYLLSYVGFNWSGKRDSNPRPSAWKADALAN